MELKLNKQPVLKGIISSCFLITASQHFPLIVQCKTDEDIEEILSLSRQWNITV